MFKLNKITFYSSPYSIVKYSLVQWKPLNVITLEQKETDNINQMLTLTKQAFRLFICKNAKWASEGE